MKEQIEARLEELKKAKEQSIANLNAIMGAITELEGLLNPKEPETKE